MEGGERFSRGQMPQLKQNKGSALAGVAQWIERRPVNQRVAGSQSRAHSRAAGQVPSRGRTRGNHTLMFPFLPSFPSL